MKKALLLVFSLLCTVLMHSQNDTTKKEQAKDTITEQKAILKEQESILRRHEDILAKQKAVLAKQKKAISRSENSEGNKELLGIQLLNDNEPSSDEDTNKGINFGVSFGYNFAFVNLYEAWLSPIDNTVLISKMSKTPFVISTVLSIPLLNGSEPIAFLSRTKKKVYQKTLGTEAFGPRYFIPYGLSFIISVNVVNFNEASSGTIFNKKIDGGIGVGYRFDENFQIAFTYELISYRQPRSFLIDDYKGKTLTVNNEVITALDEKDNRFFHDRYVGSLSVKFVYLIRSNPLK